MVVIVVVFVAAFELEGKGKWNLFSFKMFMMKVVKSKSCHFKLKKKLFPNYFISFWKIFIKKNIFLTKFKISNFNSKES